MALATHDSLTLQAETDREQLAVVLGSFQFDGDAVEQLLGDVAQQAGVRPRQRRAPAAVEIPHFTTPLFSQHWHRNTNNIAICCRV